MVYLREDTTALNVSIFKTSEHDEWSNLTINWSEMLFILIMIWVLDWINSLSYN